MRKNKERERSPERRSRPVEVPDGGKGEVTRDKILRAARQVFAVHPYHSASIRMIAKVGGFEHPLIHYYFPTKADLFDAVMAQICDELYEANREWLEGLAIMSPRQGLSSFIDRLLEYDRTNPEPFRIIVLNMSLSDRLDEIPGYQHIPEVLERSRRSFMEKVPLQDLEDEIWMFINSFNTLFISFLGARSCQAQVMGMDPDSPAYRKWVKDALMYVFLPGLKSLIRPAASRK